MGFITRRRLQLSSPKTSISKNAAALADEHDLNLTEIIGTGKGGKITIKDIRNHISQQNKPAAAPQGGSEEE